MVIRGCISVTSSLLQHGGAVHARQQLAGEGDRKGGDLTPTFGRLTSRKFFRSSVSTASEMAFTSSRACAAFLKGAKAVSLTTLPKRARSSVDCCTASAL